MKRRKPRVSTRASYAWPYERIIEYSFGSDETGQPVGGSIYLAVDQEGVPVVRLAVHSAIQVTVSDMGRIGK